MYVRVDELLKEREMTAYQLAKAVEKLGVSEQAVYRLVRAHGRITRFDSRLLGALCDVFDVEPSELFGSEKKRR